MVGSCPDMLNFYVFIIHVFAINLLWSHLHSIKMVISKGTMLQKNLSILHPNDGTFNNVNLTQQFTH